MIGALARFTAKVRVIPCGGCWEWTAAKKSTGYGNFYFERRLWIAHRWAYEYLRGPIPEGLVVDHLCRNRGCVNPSHMELVEQSENLHRGLSFTGMNARKTHCIHGHPFDEQNTYRRPDGNRDCRACAAIRKAA